MSLKLKQIVTIVFAVVMSSFPLNAAHINMLEDDCYETEIDSTVTFGVDIEGYYYTVDIKDGVVTKIELDGKEKPEFKISTDADTVLDFVAGYNTMSWLEKVQYLVVRMNVPYEYVTKGVIGMI